MQVLLLLHDGREVGAVEVAGGRAALGEVERGDGDHLLLDGHEPPVVDRLDYLVVVGDGLEDLRL